MCLLYPPPKRHYTSVRTHIRSKTTILTNWPIRIEYNSNIGGNMLFLTHTRDLLLWTHLSLTSIPTHRQAAVWFLTNEMSRDNTQLSINNRLLFYDLAISSLMALKLAMFERKSWYFSLIFCIKTSTPAFFTLNSSPIQWEKANKIFIKTELQTEDRLEYTFFPNSSGLVQFRVRAPNDAHIALSPAASEATPMYEVFIGGWGNSKSCIRKNRTKPDVAEASTPGYLNPDEYRGFWIRWENGNIQAGREGEVIINYKLIQFIIQN